MSARHADHWLQQNLHILIDTRVKKDRNWLLSSAAVGVTNVNVSQRVESTRFDTELTFDENSNFT